jgi:hypothetical protein
MRPGERVAVDGDVVELPADELRGLDRVRLDPVPRALDDERPGDRPPGGAGHLETAARQFAVLSESHVRQVGDDHALEVVEEPVEGGVPRDLEPRLLVEVVGGRGEPRALDGPDDPRDVVTDGDEGLHAADPRPDVGVRVHRGQVGHADHDAVAATHHAAVGVDDDALVAGHPRSLRELVEEHLVELEHDPALLAHRTSQAPTGR